MRKLMGTKKFSPDARLLWYTAAMCGLLLFCFSPLTPPVIGDAGQPADESAVTTEPDVSVNTVSDTPTDDGAPITPVFLMQGDNGAEVYRLQEQLQSLGYDVGEPNGVYTQATASAVRRFQLDSGFVGDGVCTAAVSYAIAALNDASADASDVPASQIRRALQERGYWSVVSEAQTEEMSEDVRQRNALILFQRTHGLYGSGEADYATLCALGLIQGADARAAAAGSEAADAAVFDLRCRLLSEALADYVLRYPAAYDLYTLTACAAVLCNRTTDARFPGSFDAVCAAGLTAAYGEMTGVSVLRDAGKDTAERRARDLLLLRASEDALRAHLSGNGYDAARGALYVYPADCPLPRDAAVCIRTKGFVFFR